jgi:hypothetical protein
VIVGRLRELALAAVAALALAGCASGGDAAACADLIDTVEQGADAISGAADDPATAGPELRAFAEDLRDAAEGASGAVGLAAAELANLYEGMADRIEAGELPDVAGVVAAAQALEAACT